jgi:uncharacterized protein (DUF983 family)
MTDPTAQAPRHLTTCPGCEGFGHIRDSKTSTRTCAVCGGEGQVEMRVDDAPPVFVGICLAVVVIIVGWVVIRLAVALDGAP